MTDNNFTDNGYTRTPLFAKVYEQLYTLITTGQLPENGLLPPETVLAEQYGVSRNTLRQALAILREDGLIYNVKGKGNFAVRTSLVPHNECESLSNPIYTSAINPERITATIHFFFHPTAAVVQEKLDITASDIAIIANLEYSQNDVPISYMFLAVPVKRIEEYKIDLNDHVVVEQLLNETIFEKAVRTRSRLTLTETEESISNYLNVALGTPVLFIEEILYDRSGAPLALSKQYLLPAYYNINFVRRNGKNETV